MIKEVLIMSDIKELNDEELEKVSGGDYVYDENGNPLYFAGYYEPNVLIFVSYSADKIYLKHEITNKMIEVINDDFYTAMAEISKK